MKPPRESEMGEAVLPCVIKLAGVSIAL